MKLLSSGDLHWYARRRFAECSQAIKEVRAEAGDAGLLFASGGVPDQCGSQPTHKQKP